jgi:hypothetical protein
MSGENTAPGLLNEIAWCTLCISAKSRVERSIEREETIMNQQQREWKIFGHILTTSELGISLLMVVALLSGVAGIWVGLISNVPVALALVGIGILVWRTTMKHKGRRIALLVLETFIWTSALAGGIAILQGAVFGFVLPLAWLAGTPFSDYTIPGLTLVIVVGGTALLAAATVFIQREWAVLVSVLAGLFMAGYEVVEVVSLDSKFGDALPTFLGMQLVYFVLGLAIFGLAGFVWMRDYRPQHFHPRHASPA